MDYQKERKVRTNPRIHTISMESIQISQLEFAKQLKMQYLQNVGKTVKKD